MSHRINVTSDTDLFYILLPGASQDGETGILKTIGDRLSKSGKTWVCVNYPFQDMGLEGPEDQSFKSEIDEVLRGVEIAKNNKEFTRVIIVAKSFGALIATEITDYIREIFKCPIDLHVLGYIFDEKMHIEDRNFNSIMIYQGELDRFGSPSKAQVDVPSSKVFTICGADHSYRNETKEPVFESDVVNALFSVIKI